MLSDLRGRAQIKNRQSRNHALYWRLRILAHQQTGHQSPETLAAQASLSSKPTDGKPLIGTIRQPQECLNGFNDTMGAPNIPERRGFRDSHSIQLPQAIFPKLNQAVNLQTFLDTVVLEKF